MFIHKIAGIVALISLGLSVSAAPGSLKEGTDIARLEMIAARLRELSDKQTIPGGVALVERHGKVLSLEAVGYRDLEHKKPMETDTIFQIMSMTKPFTGIAVMILVEEGKLELRQPIETYLPDFHNKMIEEQTPDGSMLRRLPTHPPTVWELMCHTSGLNGNPEGSFASQPFDLHASLADAVHNYAVEQPLKFEPGTHWRYSNMGIAALGRIIEVVSGEDYVHYIQTHILDPLGMKDTFFFPPESKKDRIAMVYKHGPDGHLTLSGAEILAGDPTKFRAGAKYPAPEFGLYSTAPDLVKFYRMLLNGGTSGGHRFISEAALSSMREVHTPDVNPSGWLGGTGYGLTFEIVNQARGTLLLHHLGTFGHGGAFGTEGWMDPKNDLIRILMVQVSDGTSDSARAAVMQIGEAAVVQ